MKSLTLKTPFAILALAFVGSAIAQSYTATTVAPASTFSNVGTYAINSAGQVSGRLLVSGGSRAFVWTPTVPNGTAGALSSLSYSSLPDAEAHGINSVGDTVGRASSPGKGHLPVPTIDALLWPFGAAGQIADSSGNQNECEGINDSKDIVLYHGERNYSGPAVSRVVNGKRKLYLLGNSEWPRAINNAGQVLTFSRALLWTPNATKTAWTMQNPLASYNSVTGHGMNNAGAFVGDCSSHPFVYVPSAGMYGLAMGVNLLWDSIIAAIPPQSSYPWATGSAAGINELGMVVGNLYGPGTQATAWIWNPATGVHEVTASGWTGLQVSGINNAGQIVGTASNDGGTTYSCLLLTPQ
jgi:hypothetical protein